MKRGVANRVLLAGFVGAFLLLGPLSCEVLRRYRTRPMFHNSFVIPEFGILPIWKPGPSFQSGNTLLVDLHRNVVAFIIAAETRQSTPVWPAPLENGAVALLDDMSKPFAIISVERDLLIVLERNGAERRVRLAPGQANDFYTLRTQLETDWMTFVEKIFADNEKLNEIGKESN